MPRRPYAGRQRPVTTMLSLPPPALADAPLEVPIMYTLWNAGPMASLRVSSIMLVPDSAMVAPTVPPL